MHPSENRAAWLGFCFGVPNGGACGSRGSVPSGLDGVEEVGDRVEATVRLGASQYIRAETEPRGLGLAFGCLKFAPGGLYGGVSMVG